MIALIAFSDLQSKASLSKLCCSKVWFYISIAISSSQGDYYSLRWSTKVPPVLFSHESRSCENHLASSCSKEAHRILYSFSFEKKQAASLISPSTYRQWAQIFVIACFLHSASSPRRITGQIRNSPNSSPCTPTRTTRWIATAATPWRRSRERRRLIGKSLISLIHNHSNAKQKY